jgi:hypothetical protein
VKRICARRVFWFETGHSTVCTRPAGHQSYHCDGLYWFDNNELRVPYSPTEPLVAVGAIAGAKARAVA